MFEYFYTLLTFMIWYISGKKVYFQMKPQLTRNEEHKIQIETSKTESKPANM